MAGPTLFQVKRTSVADREANTVTLPNVGEVGVNLTDGRMWVANSTGPFEIGANTKTCRVSNNFFVGNSLVNVTANSTQINTGFIQVVTAAYVGDNVDITTAGLFLGNSTVNVLANSTMLQLSNSTVNTHLAVPTVGQYGATNYFLHANGQWVQITTGGAGVTRVYQTYVATADQTVYTVSGGYTVDQIEVYENGVHLANTEYTQNGSAVTFLVGSLVGAIVEIAGYKDINISEIVPEPAGANTEVQYNDSLTTNASAGFTFDKATNNVFIANTLTVANAAISNKITANGSLGTGGQILTSNSTGGVYWATATGGGDVSKVGTPVDNQVGVWTGSGTIEGTAGFTFDSTTNNAIIANTLTVVTTGVFPTSNSSGMTLGSTTQRWNLTGNAITITGSAAVGTTLSAGNTTLANTSVTGFVNATVSVNSALLAVGAAVTANSTLINAPAINIVNQVNTATLFAATSANVGTAVLANSIGLTTTGFVNAATVVNSASHTIGTTFIANTLGAYHTGIMNAATHSVGTTFTANATLVNTAAINITGQVNTVTFFATTSANVGANVQANTTGIIVGNSTVNTLIGNTTVDIGNTTINAVVNSSSFKLGNSTVTWTLVKPTAAQVTSADYYPASDGVWKQVVGGATPGGSDTYVQYNDATLLGGSAGFTFNETTNNVVIANTITVANVTISGKITANGALGTGSQILTSNSLGGVYWAAPSGGGNVTKVGTPADDQIGVWTGDGTIEGTAGLTFSAASNNAFVGNTLTVGTATINSTNYSQTANNALNLGGTLASAYALDTDLDAYQTEAGLAANVAILDANNSTYLGGNVFANSTGAYPLSNSSGAVLGNTISRFIVTGNSVTLSTSLTSDTVNAVTSVNSALIKVGTAFIANTTGAYHTGVINAATHSVGTTFTANATLVNAAAINITGQVNTATFFATTSVNVGANVQLTTTQMSVGNTTANMVANSTTITIANSTGFSQLNPSYMYNGNGATGVLATGGVGFWYGNNTTNVTSGTVTPTTPYLQVANSTGSANLIPTGLVVGTTVVNSTVIVSGGSMLSANIQINNLTDNYTLASTDSGKVLYLANTTNKTVTILAGLPIGFRTQVIQANTGTVTVSNTGQTGVNIFSRTGAFVTTAKWGSVSIVQPTANVYIIDGSI